MTRERDLGERSCGRMLLQPLDSLDVQPIGGDVIRAERRLEPEFPEPLARIGVMDRVDVRDEVEPVGESDGVDAIEGEEVLEEADVRVANRVEGDEQFLDDLVGQSHRVVVGPLVDDVQMLEPQIAFDGEHRIEVPSVVVRIDGQISEGRVESIRGGFIQSEQGNGNHADPSGEGTDTGLDHMPSGCSVLDPSLLEVSDQVGLILSGWQVGGSVGCPCFVIAFEGCALDGESLACLAADLTVEVLMRDVEWGGAFWQVSVDFGDLPDDLIVIMTT